MIDLAMARLVAKEQSRIINTALMCGKPVHISQLRSVSPDEASLNVALAECRSKGVQILGVDHTPHSPMDFGAFRPVRERGSGCFEYVVFLGLLALGIWAAILVIDGSALALLADAALKITQAIGL